jgi:CrcB protein
VGVFRQTARPHQARSGGAFFVDSAHELLKGANLKETLFHLVGRWFVDFLTHHAVVVMLGGAVGTYARYALSKWVSSQTWAQGFPYGTLIINVSGSFILGAAAVVIRERLPPGHDTWYLLLGIGLCGGYTTFSTFEWETLSLVRDGSWWLALVNVTASVLLGFGGVLLGAASVSALLPRG